MKDSGACCRRGQIGEADLRGASPFFLSNIGRDVGICVGVVLSMVCLDTEI